jgi:hypothetical protein
LTHFLGKKQHQRRSGLCDLKRMFWTLPITLLFTLFSGGNEPRLVKAATEQLNKLPFYHSFWNRTTKPSLVHVIVHLWISYFCWWFSVSNFSIVLHIISIKETRDLNVDHCISMAFLLCW